MKRRRGVRHLGKGEELVQGGKRRSLVKLMMSCSLEGSIIDDRKYQEDRMDIHPQEGEDVICQCCAKLETNKYHPTF